MTDAPEPGDPLWSWLDAICRHLQAAGHGVEGETLFVGKRSDDADLPDKALVLTEYTGSVLEHFGTSNDMERPNLQVFVRSEVDDFVGGRARAWAVHRTLRVITNQELYGIPFLRVGPVTTPNPFGEDASRRFSWTVDAPVLLAAGA